MDLKHTWLTIIAGGQGTRLFPYSHPERPKQFCQLNARNTFIQEVVENFASLGVNRTQMVVITTNKTQTQLALEQTMPHGILSQNVHQIEETYGYAGAMIKATEFVYALDKEAVVINSPSDQYIAVDDDFYQTISTALYEASHGNPTIIGVKVSDLATVMGCGHAIYEGALYAGNCSPVTGFIEKPDEETANRIMRAGNSACNTGINVWQAKYLCEEVVKGSHQAIDEFAMNLGTDQLMNRLNNLKVAVGAFTWRDCGTLKSLYEISKKTPNHRNASLGGLIDRFECLDGLFLCDEGYRLHAAGCDGDAVIVSTIENHPIVAVINKAESARVKKLAEDFARNRDLLVNDFSIMAHNNFVMHSNISRDTIVCFICVENYIVGTHRADDGTIDVYVSKQRN